MASPKPGARPTIRQAVPCLPGREENEADQWAQTYRFGIRQGPRALRRQQGLPHQDRLSAQGAKPSLRRQRRGSGTHRPASSAPAPQRKTSTARASRQGPKSSKGSAPLADHSRLQETAHQRGDHRLRRDASPSGTSSNAEDLTDDRSHSGRQPLRQTPITDLVFNNGYENPGQRMGHKGWTVLQGPPNPLGLRRRHRVRD